MLKVEAVACTRGGSTVGAGSSTGNSLGADDGGDGGLSGMPSKLVHLVVAGGTDAVIV